MAGLTAPTPANNQPPTEAVTVQGQGGITGTGAAAGLTAPGTEAVEVTGTKANTSPSIMDLIQSSPEARSAEKGALTTALFQLLFPQGGGQYAGSGGPEAAPGAAPGAGGPAAAAAIAQTQSGQAGSSSSYAPGSPILGDPTGANKSSPWNVESLRTSQGVT